MPVIPTPPKLTHTAKMPPRSSRIRGLGLVRLPTCMETSRLLKTMDTSLVGKLDFVRNTDRLPRC